tara:strand:+ start:296 stop:619 length:324 start_codon:yes stop_codon:yes gene_type:complete
LREHNRDAEGNIGGGVSGGGGEIMATGPSERETYVLPASYWRRSANSHTPRRVLAVVVLGGDEEDVLVRRERDVRCAAANTRDGEELLCTLRAPRARHVLAQRTSWP